MMDINLLGVESCLALMVAICFGVMGTMAMKFSHGFTKLKPSLAVGVFYALSFVAMTLALKSIPISVVYAIWSGVGTILVVILSVFLFKEPISYRKAFFLLLIIIGIIGIQLSDGALLVKG